MDLQTENKLAAILLKEAAELRRQAQQEGVLAYLRQPKARGRPNSRFLTATVLGVQQANRAVEENEMWRSRQKERELDSRIQGRFREESSGLYHSNTNYSQRKRSERHADARLDSSPSSSSKRRDSENYYLREDDGLRDDEVEEFLHSRTKRGRGAVGSRMDETGPYLPSCTDSTAKLSPSSGMGLREEQRNRVVLGPQTPASLRSDESSNDESLPKKRKTKKQKQHKGEHKSKYRSNDRKKRKKREEKRSKHRKK